MPVTKESLTFLTPILVEGVAYWASTHKTSDMSGKYEINITNIEDKQILKQLKEFGRLKKGEGEHRGDWGYYITPKNRKQPTVYTPEKTLLDPNSFIPNGSRVKVVVKPYTNSMGTFLTFSNVFITEMAEGGGYDKNSELKMLGIDPTSVDDVEATRAYAGDEDPFDV